MEVDFPRGHVTSGPASTAPKRKKKELLFKRNRNEEEPDYPAVNKKFKSMERTKKRKEQETPSEDKVIIDSLTLTNLPTDIVVLGLVISVSDFEVNLMIPGGIRVSVPVFNISTPYSSAMEDFMERTGPSPIKPSDMFTYGQKIPLRITGSEETGRKENLKFTATMNPSDVNKMIPQNMIDLMGQIVIPCAVESQEDHGYVMNIGFEGMKGFLPKTQVNSKEKLPIGIVVSCVATDGDSRVLTLSMNQKLINSCLLKGVSLTPNCLIPGTRVRVLVMAVTDYGLEISIGGDVKGFVHKNHLESVWDLPKSNYNVNETYDGTVLFVHPLTHFVSVTIRSMASDVFAGDETSTSFKVGDKIENATIVHVEEKGTVILQTKKLIKLVATKNHLSDQFIDESKIRSEFPIGSQHSSVVLSVNPIDGYLKVSLKPSRLLAETSIDYDDVHVGSILKGNVVKMTETGMLIKIGVKMRAFVRNIHLSDGLIKNREKVFPLDKEVKCRILHVDRTSKEIKMLATCKPSLMDPNLFLLDDKKKAVTGQEALGVVVFKNDHGVLLEFFNKISGFLGEEVLGKTVDPITSFQIGSLIPVVVRFVDKRTDKISLTLPSAVDKDVVMQRILKAKGIKRKESWNKKEEKKPKKEVEVTKETGDNDEEWTDVEGDGDGDETNQVIVQEEEEDSNDRKTKGKKKKSKGKKKEKE